MFNLRDSGVFVVGKTVLKSAIHQISGGGQYPLQCYSKHYLSSSSRTAWEDWQFCLTNTGNVLRLSPMFSVHLL